MRLDKLAEKAKELYTVQESSVRGIARADILNTLDLYVKERLWGGIELKVEDGKITYFKDWKCRKY